MSKSKTTQKVDTTSTPTNPSWVNSALQGYTGQVQNWGANTNARDLVAPTSPLQQQAFDQAGAMQTSPLFGEAAGIARGAVNNASAQDLMSPYTNDVVNTTLAGYDANSARQNAALAAAGARNNGFGGSRFGVAQAIQAGEQGQGRAAAEAQLRDQAFNTGQGLYADAQNRNLSAAGLLGNLGQAEGSEGRANIGLLSDLGGVQRGIDANYRTADLSMLQALGGLYGQGQYGLFNGSNTRGTTTNTSDPGLLGTVGQLAQTGASLAALFSDRRLKRNIVALGGGWYAYNYLWSDDLEVGVMADEQPQAAMEGPGGFLMVDYGRVQ